MTYLQINVQRLKQDLMSCVCEIIFKYGENLNEMRMMKGTLMSRYLPPDFDIKTHPTLTEDQQNMIVWDIEHNQFRCFPLNTVLSCQILHGYN